MFISLPKPGMENWIHLNTNLNPLVNLLGYHVEKDSEAKSVHLQRVPLRMSSKDKKERNNSTSVPDHPCLQQILLVFRVQNILLLITEP